MPPPARRLYFEAMMMPPSAQRCYCEVTRMPLRAQRCYCEVAGIWGMLAGVYCSALEKIFLCRGVFTALHWKKSPKDAWLFGDFLYLCRHKVFFNSIHL